MVWQGIDKRRFPRINYPCKVIVLRSDLKETFATHTENIGTGGICVILPRQILKFCMVEVLVYLQNGKGPLECNGRVVWSINKNNTFDTGIEFIDLKAVDSLRIEKIIQECLNE